MTIFTEIPVRRSALDDYQSPLGDVLAATAKESLLFSPLSSVTRAGELVKAQEGEPKGFLGFGGREEPDSSLMRPEDARDRVRDAGVDLTIPEEGIRARALEILIERKTDEKRRQDVFARAPGGFVSGAAQIGVGLGASLLDPLNVAAAFIPIVGEARYTALLARATGIGGRTAIRAGVGVAEGLAGAALVEPLIYRAATQEQADYDLTDSLLNIGVGGVLGGGLHVGVGAAADAIGKGLSWRQARPVEAMPEELSALDFQGREAVLRAAVSQALDSQPIDIEAVLAAQARRILSKEAPAVRAERQATNLSRFIAGMGGVQDFKGELRALDLDKTFVPGIGRLVREGGRKLDMAREAAAEAGYFDHIYGDADTAVANSTVSDLLDALSQDARGDRIYSSQDAGRLSAQADAVTSKAARDRLRQRLDQLSQEMESELPDEIVLDAVRFMDEGEEAADAIERAIVRDYNINGALIPLERADGSQFEIPPGWETPDVGRGRLAQRQAAPNIRADSRRGPGGGDAADSRPSGNAGKDTSDNPQAELEAATLDLERLGISLGVQDVIGRELAQYDALIEDASTYGRAMQAAASCQLRRGE